ISRRAAPRRERAVASGREEADRLELWPRRRPAAHPDPDQPFLPRRVTGQHIMSAIPIPKTAPFLDEEIELLNRVVGPASPTQRAWLAGFLAGVEVSFGGTPQPAAPVLPAEPLT